MQNIITASSCSNSTTPTISSISSSSTSSSSEFNSKTCQSCRKLHRKCDKLLPSCSYCIKRGYICCYEKSSANQQQEIKQQQELKHSNIVQVQFNTKKNLSSYRSTPYPSTNTTTTTNHIATTTNHIATTANHIATTTNHTTSINGSVNDFNHQLIMMNNNTSSSSINQSSISFVNNMTRIFNQQLQMNYRMITNQTLDIYYQYLSNGFPMVDRRILERVLDYHSIVSGNDYSVNNCFSSSMMNQFYENVSDFEKDQCLLFTLQALCLQQIGHKEASNQVYSNARQLIGKYFDEVDHQSIMIAMTFMGIYLVGEGEKRKAKSILSSVKSAIAPYKNVQSNRYSAMASFSLPEPIQELKDDNSISEWVITQPKCFTSFLIDTQLRSMEAYFGEEDYPTSYILDGLELMGNNNLKLTKLREMIPDCRSLTKEVIDSLLSLLPALECLANVILTNFNRMPTLKLIYAFLFKQLHLDILKNAEESIRDIPMMLNIASQVIELTKDELFIYLPICAIKPIIMAATLRMHHFNSLSTNENVSDDLRALKILSRKFKAIQTCCTPLMKALESLIYLQQSKTSSLESFFDFGDVFSIESLSNYSPSPSAHSRESLTPQYIFDSYQSEFNPLFKSFGIDTEIIDVFIENMSEQEKLYNSDKTKLKEKRMELVNMFKSISGKKKDVFGVVASEFLKKQLAMHAEN